MAAAASEETETRNPMADDSFTLFSFVDEVESRVEVLRKQATALMGERASLLMIMDQLKSDCLNGDISAEDRQELVTNMSRLKARCEAVQIEVNTVRDEGQLQSLEKVNSAINELHTRIVVGETVAVTTVQQARCFLNACLSEAIGPIDSRFQSLVLGCALDDQKDVRRRLESLVRDCDSGIESRALQSARSSSRQPPTQETNNSAETCESQGTDMAAPPTGPSTPTANLRSAETSSDDHPVENFLTDQWFSAPKGGVADTDRLGTQQEGESIQHPSNRYRSNSPYQHPENDTLSHCSRSANS